MGVMRLWCDQCGKEVTPVDGVNAVWSRGYWWCAKHCAFICVDGVYRVAFPSEGKLRPETIMSPIEEQQDHGVSP